MDEQQQIRRAQRGDKQALAAVLQRNYRFLRRYAIKMTMNPHRAEDLVQETMLRCIEKIHLYNGSSKFSSWLITIATRLYIDQMRRVRVERRWREQEQWDLRLESGRNGRSEEESVMMQALHDLAYDVRLPIVLRHYYGYTYEEIGRIMEIPSGTVKSRVHNGMNQLRKEWSEDEDGRGEPKK